MKQLIFIDNDNEKRAIEDADDVKNNLELIGGLPSKYVDNMKIVSDFSSVNKDEAYDMLFNPNNVVCSWSMFTASHYNSLYQMLGFLNAAGSANIKGQTFIDGSGMMLEALNRQIRSLKNAESVVNIITAIKNNFIISFDTKNQKCGRIYPAFHDYEVFGLSDIDIEDLFN